MGRGRRWKEAPLLTTSPSSIWWNKALSNLNQSTLMANYTFNIKHFLRLGEKVWRGRLPHAHRVMIMYVMLDGSASFFFITFCPPRALRLWLWPQTKPGNFLTDEKHVVIVMPHLSASASAHAHTRCIPLPAQFTHNQRRQHITTKQVENAFKTISIPRMHFSFAYPDLVTAKRPHKPFLTHNSLPTRSYARSYPQIKHCIKTTINKKPTSVNTKSINSQ